MTNPNQTVSTLYASVDRRTAFLETLDAFDRISRRLLESRKIRRVWMAGIIGREWLVFGESFPPHTLTIYR